MFWIFATPFISIDIRISIFPCVDFCASQSIIVEFFSYSNYITQSVTLPLFVFWYTNRDQRKVLCSVIEKIAKSIRNFVCKCMDFLEMRTNFISLLFLGSTRNRLHSIQFMVNNQNTMIIVWFNVIIYFMHIIIHIIQQYHWILCKIEIGKQFTQTPD